MQAPIASPRVARKLRRLRSPLGVAAVVGVLGLGLGLAPALDARADHEGPAGLVERVAQLALEGAAVTELPRESLAPLIKRVQPAVVSIRAMGAAPGPRGIFGPPGAAIPRGVGSGFIIDADGIVVTNHHVVAGASSLEVKLHDGRLLEARVLGTDPHTDLAVLELETPEGASRVRFPTVKLGDSRSLEVGDFVLAIGSPMGLEQTVTRGIISAKGRGDLGLYPDSYVDFVQTDAAISPGSSGGPLVNMRGEVVAVNTAVAGIGRGLGFAVPAAQVEVVVPQLRREGRVARGWLGVAGRDVEPAVGQAPVSGAVLGEVVPGTPAADAGLRPGDRVVEVDGAPVESFGDLRGRIAERRPGSSVRLGLEREGRRQVVKVTLAERDARGPAGASSKGSAAPPGDPGGGLYEGRPELGVEVRAVDVEGSPVLEVRRVRPGSVADQLGLAPGDRLRRINGVDIEGVDDVRRALARDPRRVEVEAERGGGRFVGVLRAR